MAWLRPALKRLLRLCGFPPSRRDFFAGSAPPGDGEFIDEVYRRFLGREADPSGKRFYLESLRGGLSRLDLIQCLVSGDEHLRRVLVSSALQLPSLKELRPEKYRSERLRGSREKALAFAAEGPEDFAWLARCIDEYGYYDAPGVWSREPDEDKQVIAAMAAAFAPTRVLEIGCFAGAVLALLAQRGIAAEGVEVSHLALTLAPPALRRRIHFGDLRSLELPGYDLILGMDVFEHLNPGDLPAYLERCAQLLGQGGYVLTNLPAYGPDPVFGEVHPYFFEAWEQHQDQGRFNLLHVDGEGWPINGHLAWATSAWWQGRFAQAGFTRQPEIERALHQRWDGFFKESAPARLSLYVFSLGRTPEQAREVARRAAQGA